MLIETAEIEFYQTVEEELQRRAKEVELTDHHDKPKKTVKNMAKGDGDSDTDEQQPDVEGENGHSNGHHVNGTTNGHTNGHSDVKASA